MLIRRQLVCSHHIPCKCPGGGITKSLDELRLPDSRVAREVFWLPTYDGQVGQGGWRCTCPLSQRRPEPLLLTSVGNKIESKDAFVIGRPLQHLCAHPAPEPLNALGAGLITCPPAGVTFITARPRWLVPSARKRNRPSMPVKPDELISTCSEKR
jgi:hypothetical protein